MSKFEKIVRITKNLVNPDYLAKTNYLKYYKNIEINNKRIVLDSQHGNNIKGNIYYILKELVTNKKYADYEVYVGVNPKAIKKFKYLLDSENLSNYQLLNMHSKEYYKILSSAKYIISDTSLLPFFVKKEGQVYLNVWHGTPYKCLGKGDNTNFHAIGNIQKNFFCADYILYPNDYMKKNMIKDFMLENICDAKILMSGYPRNTVFFDKKRQQEIKKELNLSDKEIITYMPTWRSNKNEPKIVENYLKEMDKNLKENQVLFVNLHPFVGDSIDYSMFKNIYKFPDNYETYEFLSISDILITDYSSVFFDFAVTKRKILLFTYDLEDYFKTRGCYFDIDELPFKRAYNIKELVSLMNQENDINYDKFLKTFAKYEGIDATKKLCEKVILNKDVVTTLDMPKNKKKNILIYTGSLSKNGITTALLNLINSVDLSKYNYYLTFSQNVVEKNKQVIKEFPHGINYIATIKGSNGSIYDKIITNLFIGGKKLSRKTINKVNELFDFEIKRNYHNLKFDTVIQFGGYDSRKILLFSRFNCNKVIYLHSNMEREVKLKNNQKVNVLNYAYDKYDKIVVVNDSLIESTTKFVKDESKIKVANNIIDYKTVIEKSKQKIKFDEETESNIKLEKLEEILNDKNKVKFINVGRYSLEKGHERLIKAFNKIYKKNKNAYLIIIGGYGNLYQDTIDLAETLPCKNNIAIIKSLSNPFPIVKKCDCFVLSSLYEGFGLCLVEADILGLQSFSVDIDGPKKFIELSKGNLVSNSEDGIVEGMKKYLNGDLKKMQANYEEYNQKALKEFYDLLK